MYLNNLKKSQLAQATYMSANEPRCCEDKQSGSIIRAVGNCVSPKRETWVRELLDSIGRKLNIGGCGGSLEQALAGALPKTLHTA